MSKFNTIELINELFKINHELIVNFKKYVELRSIKEAEENIINSKIIELSETKLSCVESQKNLEELKGRNTSIRDNFSTIDGFLKEKSEMICEEAKMILGRLGLKMNVIELEDSQNLLEVIFQFSNDNSCYVKLIYDIDTDDYDLLEMVPTPTNFNDIKRFLREKGDIQGMLFHFRNCNRHNINMSNMSDDDRSSFME